MELETEEMSMGLGLGVYTCNPGAWEVEAEGRFKVSQAYVVRPETLSYGGGGIYIYIWYDHGYSISFPSIYTAESTKTESISGYLWGGFETSFGMTVFWASVFSPVLERKPRAGHTLGKGYTYSSGSELWVGFAVSFLLSLLSPGCRSLRLSLWPCALLFLPTWVFHKPHGSSYFLVGRHYF